MGAGRDEDRDARVMHRALECAARGPAADPNPRVGAVILDPAGSVVGEGWHDGAGTAHAEVVALREAGAAAAGGTAYVTLEPCRHTGRTGPCTEALRAAGIGRVVFGQSDPSADAGGGAARLAEASVVVRGGVLAAEAEQLNRAWSFAVTAGRPMVTWKYAATLDGFVAAADGSSRWITSAESRADVHARRSACGAILVGTGTALADDPQLTVRGSDGRPHGRQPLRVVMGRRPVPASARVLDQAAPTLLLRTRDPHDALQQLHEREVRHVWLEGGPTVAAAFLRTGLVDEVLAYLAPTLLGSGSSVTTGLGVGTLADALPLRLAEVTRIGPDLRLTASPTKVQVP